MKKDVSAESLLDPETERMVWRFKRALKYRQMKHRQLATLIGGTHTQVRHWASSQAIPTLWLGKVCRELGMSPWYYLTGEHRVPPGMWYGEPLEHDQTFQTLRRYKTRIKRSGGGSL